MRQLMPESVVKAGGEVGRVVAVGATLPIAVAIATIEGNGGRPITQAVISTAANVGQRVGEFVTQEAPAIALRMAVGDVSGIIYTALKGGGGDQGSCDCDIA